MTRAPLRPVEWLALAGLVAQQVIVALVVPDSPLRHLGRPVYQALVASAAIAVLLVALRFRASRNVRLEQLLLALFLAGMPVIDVATAVLDGAAARVIAVELAGVAVFGALAVAGWARSPWFLAIGIGAHGLAWDLWHHPHALVVPPWYAFGCLVVDVALAGYVATQIPAYRGAPVRA